MVSAQEVLAKAGNGKMTGDDLPPFLHSLLAAVSNAPEDLPLRLHVARALLEAGYPAKALEHCGAAMEIAPGNREVAELLASVTSALIGKPAPGGSGAARPGGPPVASAEPPVTPGGPPVAPGGPPRQNARPPDGADVFDWAGAEEQMTSDDHSQESPQLSQAGGLVVERPQVRLADVGGMEQVKREIQLSFLIPAMQPELRTAYNAAVGGGMLLFGPPGCGKTFIGRALAGEVGAGFLAVSLADVLDMWLGESEKNVCRLFEHARANRPAVVFLDEVDAIGQKRTNLRASPAMRGTVNQLLSEMDGVTGLNDGVFVLAATNQPWDIDPALRRPGRLDRAIFVPPPDRDARIAILRVHLRDRPLGKIDFDRLGSKTEDFSGADLAHLCATATRLALANAAKTKEVRPVGMSELEAARRQVKPSTVEWFSTARHVAAFGNQDGMYDDLIAYLKSRKLW